MRIAIEEWSLRQAIELSLSKRNSRPIVVDGIRYRWSFSAPYNIEKNLHKLNLTVQLASGGTKLIGTGHCATNNRYLLESTVIMRPANVAQIISFAIANGWNATGDKDYMLGEIENFVPMESRLSSD